MTAVVDKLACLSVARILAHLLVELDVLHYLQREREVAEKAVHAQQPDDTEVAEHAVEWAHTVLADNLSV